MALVVDANVGYRRLVSAATKADEHLVVCLEHGIAVVQIGRVSCLGTWRQRKQLHSSAVFWIDLHFMNGYTAICTQSQAGQTR